MKRMLSGIKPTGQLHLGSYLGALRHFVNYQDEYEMYAFIANLHCITMPQDPVELQKNLLDCVALYIACGLDPKKATIFLQTDVKEHAQLGFIMCCHTYMGELNRMTQFKDKQAKGEKNLSGGIYTYPTLMAADILLYDADYVPVGDDQKQHVELTRDVATRMNNRYGDIFNVPEPLIAKVGARIMSLTEPTKKMSKSDENVNAVVYILDDRDTIIRKFKRAVTDSDTSIRYAEGKDGINNLMTIYSTFTGKTFDEIEREFDGKGYGDFKMAVGEVCADALAPVQEKYKCFINDKAQLEAQMKKGAEEASYVARRTLSKVQKKLGFVQVR